MNQPLFSPTINITEQGVTYIVTPRLNVSLDKLLQHSKADEYCKQAMIDIIIALAAQGFTEYGLEKFCKGDLDRKGPCVAYCKSTGHNVETILNIIKPTAI